MLTVTQLQTGHGPNRQFEEWRCMQRWKTEVDSTRLFSTVGRLSVTEQFGDF